MKKRLVANFLGMALFCFGASAESAGSELQGRFDKSTDLYLAHFDLKTDVDDIQSVAAVATMLADARLAGVSYHAVAGAYGTQGGNYVPGNEVFDMAFGSNWSDAHADFDKALAEVASRAEETLRAGGRVWIADGGQSDFSAAVAREMQKRLPSVDLGDLFHVVQHSEWNESVTTPEDLAFLEEVASYHKIPDGNATGNGTPGFRSDHKVDWQRYVRDPHLKAVWEKAITVAETYNGVDHRYLNESIKKGGLDFSDTSETVWIFGFEGLVDSEDFFETFSSDGISSE